MNYKEKYTALKNKDCVQETVNYLKSIGVFLMNNPNRPLLALPDDLSTIEDNNLGDFLFSYQIHANWIRTNIGLISMQLEQNKRMLKIAEIGLTQKNRDSGIKLKDIKIDIALDDFYGKQEDSVIKLENNLSMLKVVFDNLTDISKTISREITIRGLDQKAFPIQRTMKTQI